MSCLCDIQVKVLFFLETYQRALVGHAPEEVGERGGDGERVEAVGEQVETSREAFAVRRVPKQTPEGVHEPYELADVDQRPNEERILGRLHVNRLGRATYCHCKANCRFFLFTYFIYMYVCNLYIECALTHCVQDGQEDDEEDVEQVERELEIEAFERLRLVHDANDRFIYSTRKD